MLSPTVLDIVIGMAYVYFFFSVLAAGLNEWYARVVRRRSKVLQSAITRLLSSRHTPTNSRGAPQKQSLTLAEKFHKHPLIVGLADRDEYPSYIPASTFGLVLIDLAIDAASISIDRPRVVNGLRKDLAADEKRVIEALISGESNIQVVQARIEKWFSDAGDRISGQYKRATYKSLLLISLLVSFACGVDTIAIVKRLYTDPVQRAIILDQARNVRTDPVPPEIPIGWKQASDLWFLGIPLTSLALTFGSPFWFEFLNRFVNLRQTGKPPEKQEAIFG